MYDGEQWQEVDLTGPQGDQGHRGRKGAPGRDGSDGAGIEDIFFEKGVLAITYSDGRDPFSFDLMDAVKEFLIDIAVP